MALPGVGGGGGGGGGDCDVEPWAAAPATNRIRLRPGCPLHDDRRDRGFADGLWLWIHRRRRRRTLAQAMEAQARTFLRFAALLTVVLNAAAVAQVRGATVTAFARDGGDNASSPFVDSSGSADAGGAPIVTGIATKIFGNDTTTGLPSTTDSTSGASNSTPSASSPNAISALAVSPLPLLVLIGLVNLNFLAFAATQHFRLHLIHTTHLIQQADAHLNVEWSSMCGISLSNYRLMQSQRFHPRVARMKAVAGYVSGAGLCGGLAAAAASFFGAFAGVAVGTTVVTLLGWLWLAIGYRRERAALREVKNKVDPSALTAAIHERLRATAAPAAKNNEATTAAAAAAARTRAGQAAAVRRPPAATVFLPGELAALKGGPSIEIPRDAAMTAVKFEKAGRSGAVAAAQWAAKGASSAWPMRASYTTPPGDRVPSLSPSPLPSPSPSPLPPAYVSPTGSLQRPSFSYHDKHHFEQQQWQHQQQQQQQAHYQQHQQYQQHQPQPPHPARENVAAAAHTASAQSTLIRNAARPRPAPTPVPIPQRIQVPASAPRQSYNYQQNQPPLQQHHQHQQQHPPPPPPGYPPPPRHPPPASSPPPPPPQQSKPKRPPRDAYPRFENDAADGDDADDDNDYRRRRRRGPAPPPVDVRRGAAVDRGGDGSSDGMRSAAVTTATSAHEDADGADGADDDDDAATVVTLVGVGGARGPK